MAIKSARFDEDSISLYLKEISHYPLLTPEQEVSLAKAYKRGEKKAIEKMVLCNLRFVVSIAKKYQNLGVSLSDLINEGNIGLIRAAHKFDETKGVRFITYAVWWIKQAIIQYLSEQSRIVRIPLNKASAMFKMEKMLNTLAQELGRDPTTQEIIQGIDVAEQDIHDVLPLYQPQYSLDSSSNPQDDIILLNSIPDDKTPGPLEGVFKKDLNDLIENMLSTIKDREARILRFYFGLDNTEPMTLEEIGEIFGVTRERVRQIKEKAIKQLKQANRNKAIESFLS
ncbi:MAG: RNA polymerase subunit sigma [Candidatus Glassbacteria bacterium RIFCSPLOWO2_12_FULL_58_11]|uniref:RNA polymerase subunit sigma n=1 Tax=Candidatus Glassbacteria bacterium RIFCSPLOWO2_12_FULL_58_11 TaxID=1817867 RepID=A0A1F5YKZ3_9BACT|nr:MAG: RNA polymerase subunit sigma [Candidatus Glassbacteria bacterium RIFCSPLOWO2_12_FULL_58_11]